MTTGEHSRAEEFFEALQRLTELLSPLGVSKSFGALADAYDLSAAKDEIERFVKTGADADFRIAQSRLSALVERSAIKNRYEARKLLNQLSAVAASLTRPDLRAVMALRERGSPDSNTAVNTTPSSDVLVIAAMYEPELAAFLPRISPYNDFVGTEKSGLPEITYFVGSLLTQKVGTEPSPISITALFLNRNGLTDCSSLVASGIRVFRPKLIAMTGVCAGRQSMNVKKNDIIVPASSFTYDSGKYTNAGFEREPHWAEASTRVIQRVSTRGQAVLDNMVRQIEMTLPGKVRRPSVYYDVMACGSGVVDKEGMIDGIAQAVHRKVIGLDMESYAFFRSATLTDPSVPRIVVKGVMDFSTGKSDAVKAQAAFWAAAFLTTLISLDFDQLTGH